MSAMSAMIGFDNKSAASQAAAALSHLGQGGKPLRYEGREKFSEHVAVLFRAFGKASPFANGSLKFPRPDPSRNGQPYEVDLKYAFEYTDPTAASQSVSRPLMAAGERTDNDMSVAILSATLMGSGAGGGSGVKVSMGLLAAYRQGGPGMD